MTLSRLLLIAALSACTGIACKGDSSTPQARPEAPPEATAPGSSASAGSVGTAPPAAAASGCLVDEGGCGFKPAAIEPCAEADEELEILTLDQLLGNPAAHAGKQVALRGPLTRAGAGCTEMACTQTCCNICTAIITIGDPRAGDVIRLESPTNPGLYRCSGDESLVCCQVDARGQEVIALGTFEPVRSVTPPVYQLWTTEICTPL